MERTGFKDVDGTIIYGGQAVEYWDDEGGCGIGITVLHPKHGWMIINPAKDFRDNGELWCITTLEAFKNSVRLMRFKDRSQ